MRFIGKLLITLVMWYLICLIARIIAYVWYVYIRPYVLA
jgi:hypothetical protein